MPAFPSPRELPHLPLQGVHVLAVEDSLHACEGLRLMIGRLGGRMRRAADLAEARRHLDARMPDAVIVDIGLPDGSGLDLLRDLQGACWSGIALACSGDGDHEQAALDAGARAFFDKARHGGIVLIDSLVAMVPRRPSRGWRHGGQDPDLDGDEDEGDDADVDDDAGLRPDPLALRGDLARVADALAAGVDPAGQVYLARFLTGLAGSLRDERLFELSRQLEQGDGAVLRRIERALRTRIAALPQPFGPAG